MADLKLPVVEADASPQQALDKMRTWGRSGVVIKLDGVHALMRAAQLQTAIECNVTRVAHVPGMIVLAPHLPAYPKQRWSLLHADYSGALLRVHEDWLPMLEPYPQICRCENGHEGSVDGAKCSECQGTVHCVRL
jgi:hypothetical protein